MIRSEAKILSQQWQQLGQSNTIANQMDMVRIEYE